MIRDINTTFKRLLWRRLREGGCFKDLSSYIESVDRFSMREIEELKSMSKSDVPAYTRRYRLFASDAHSRWEYDAERLQYIKKASSNGN